MPRPISGIKADYPAGDTNAPVRLIPFLLEQKISFDLTIFIATRPSRSTYALLHFLRTHQSAAQGPLRQQEERDEFSGFGENLNHISDACFKFFFDIHLFFYQGDPFEVKRNSLKKLSGIFPYYHHLVFAAIFAPQPHHAQQGMRDTMLVAHPKLPRSFQSNGAAN